MTDRKFIPVNIAILTISDSRTFENDRSGDVLANCIESEGHILKNREIVKDDRPLISEKLMKLCNRIDIDTIITPVGTGLTGRDVTVKANTVIDV